MAANLWPMQQRTTFEPGSGRDETAADERAPFIERLWRNHLGILLAIGLTLAAASLLLWSRQG